MCSWIYRPTENAFKRWLIPHFRGTYPVPDIVPGSGYKRQLKQDPALVGFVVYLLGAGEQKKNSHLQGPTLPEVRSGRASWRR